MQCIGSACFTIIRFHHKQNKLSSNENYESKTHQIWKGKLPLYFGTSKYLFPSPPLGGPIVNGADICLPTINTGSLSATHHIHSSLFGSALDLLDLKYLEMEPSNIASVSSNVCQIYWDTWLYILLSNESISKYIIPNVVVGWGSKSSRSLWRLQSRLEKETC